MNAVTLTIVSLNCALLLSLVACVRKLLTRLDHRHRKDTYAATTRGLFLALQDGYENGGLTPEARRAIYRAAQEQWDLHEAAS